MENTTLNVTKRREMRADPQLLRSLVEGAGSVKDIVIEVKNADKVTRHDATGLEAFHADYPESTCTLLYRGNEALKITENCLALPVERFLREMVPNAPLPVVPHSPNENGV